MIMGGVGIRDSKKYVVTAGLTLHLDTSSISYSGFTGATWSDISGNGRRFYSRHAYNAAAKIPIFTRNPTGHYGFEMNGFIAEYVGMPEQFRRGAYYFQEITTAINFDTSWTLEFLACTNGAGRPDDGCGSKVSGLFIKMGDGSNTTTQWWFNGHRVNFGTVDPANFGGLLPDTSTLINCGPIIDGAASNVNSYRASVLTSYFTDRVPFYISFCFNKQSASVYNFLYYINGNLYHTSANQTYVAAPAGDFRIGGGDNNCGAANGWRGWIHDVRMYNRVLTAAEIKQNYHAVRGKGGA